MSSISLLRDLQQAHAELLKFISELEAVLSADVIQVTQLARARLQLSKASLYRKKVVAAAIQRLSQGSSADDTRGLSLLRKNDAAIAAVSSQHVREWSMETILANCERYRAASAVMRKSMLERIATEKATLYPLLERAASHLGQ